MSKLAKSSRVPSGAILSTGSVSPRLWTLNALKVLKLSFIGLTGETHEILDFFFGQGGKLVVDNTFVIVAQLNTVSDIKIFTLVLLSSVMAIDS